MNTNHSVKELMTPDVMTVEDDMTTDALARYLTEHEISGAPVVDDQGHVIGVVSMADISRNLAESEAALGAGFDRDAVTDLTLEDLGQRYVEERAFTVRDVMTPLIHQVPATASAAEAARLMIDHHVHRLIVTEGKEPVGILTSIDLLKVVATPR
ncbi:MAG: hypothetical protein RJA55_2877 [Acidobacteriota bacterium]|jgi:predicted transcriptional regulator